MSVHWEDCILSHASPNCHVQVLVCVHVGAHVKEGSAEHHCGWRDTVASDFGCRQMVSSFPLFSNINLPGKYENVFCEKCNPRELSFYTPSHDDFAGETAVTGPDAGYVALQGHAGSTSITRSGARHIRQLLTSNTYTRARSWCGGQRPSSYA